MKPLTEHELAVIDSEARRLGPAGASMSELLGEVLPRLLAELREARGEAGALRAALEKEKAARVSAAKDPSPRPARGGGEALDEEAADAAGALLAAPFRVSAKAAAAARSDPLAALAVQVAKALSPDAGALERARLIAMAFAASQGDLDAFWTARRQRRASPRPVSRGPLRKR